VSLKDQAKRALGAAGYEMRKANPPGPRRLRLIERFGVAAVIDVGGNRGQYGSRLRAAGYAGPLYSFEPQPDPFAALAAGAAADPLWHVANVGLGAAAGTVEMNVADGDDCSSILETSPALRSSLPEATAVDRIEIPLHRLDDSMAGVQGPFLLKIDTQGYEHAVLDGAADVLARTHVIDIEMALSRNYEGGSSIYDLMPRLHSLGFQALSVEPGFMDRATEQVLDADVLLVRADLLG
jgi:FkbM family methyltransferase